MKEKEVASSLVLVLFGLGFLLYNLTYSFDSWANPGPGVFPFMVGAVLVLLAGWQLLRAFWRAQPAGDRDKTRKRIGPAKEWFRKDKAEARPVLLVLLLVLYLLMVKWIGFFASNFFFVILSSRLMGAKDWGRSIALSAGVNLFCYALFDVWLNLAFPRGVFF